VDTNKGHLIALSTRSILKLISTHFGIASYYSGVGILVCCCCLMLKKKIKQLMTLCLLFTVSSSFGFFQLHFIAVIIDVLVFIWKLNLLRLIPHDQISLLLAPATFALNF
jgi:hypothetical protein